jgi:predicted glutamine amidotransferase
MCLICFAPDGVGITEEEAINGFKRNSDGAGIAWKEDGLLRYKKGLMTIDAFNEVYFGEKVCDKFPHTVHFRAASKNYVKEELTHPFIVDNNSALIKDYSGVDPILFHNGVFSKWETMMLQFYVNKGIKIPEGEWSDTRFIAVLTSFLGEKLLELLDDKFVLMYTDRAEMYGSFLKFKDRYFSNSSYKATGYSTYTSNKGGWDGSEYIYGI